MIDDASDPPRHGQDDAPHHDSGGALPTGLVLVPTPLGNLGDVTNRALAVLREADVILCEDSRVTARLARAFGLTAPLSPLHEHNEDARLPEVLGRLRAGALVALVSDAGTPLVSDPGYRLVRAAIGEGLPVAALPGPNAAVLALVLSGLPPLPFLVLGFPPPRAAARRSAFARLRAAEQAGLRATLVWYEAPHRAAETLADLHEAFGDRPAALARELTKRFEQVRRGTLGQLAAGAAADPPRGEVTLVVGPAPEEPAADAATLDEALHAALARHSLKEAVAIAAAATGLPRRTVYARALALRAPG